MTAIFNVRTNVRLKNVEDTPIVIVKNYRNMFTRCEWPSQATSIEFQHNFHSSSFPFRLFPSIVPAYEPAACSLIYQSSSDIRHSRMATQAATTRRMFSHQILSVTTDRHSVINSPHWRQQIDKGCLILISPRCDRKWTDRFWNVPIKIEPAYFHRFNVFFRQVIFLWKDFNTMADITTAKHCPYIMSSIRAGLHMIIVVCMT